MGAPVDSLPQISDWLGSRARNVAIRLVILVASLRCRLVADVLVCTVHRPLSYHGPPHSASHIIAVYSACKVQSGMVSATRPSHPPATAQAALASLEQNLCQSARNTSETPQRHTWHASCWGSKSHAMLAATSRKHPWHVSCWLSKSRANRHQRRHSASSRLSYVPMQSFPYSPSLTVGMSSAHAAHLH